MGNVEDQVRAGVYARISRDQVGTGLGVERQEATCRELAERLGWSVVEVYVDNDISAYSGRHRPAYSRLLADINAGRITGVLAWAQDRINRSPLELERLIGVLDRHHVPLHTVAAGVLDLSTPAGRAVARTLGAWARYESEHKSARIRAKLLQQAQAGELPGGAVRPFGYLEDRVTIDRREAAVIRGAMRRLLAGETIRQIAGDLNQRGVLMSTGVPIQASTLARVLTSARVCGWRDTPPAEGLKPRYGTAFLARGTWAPIVPRSDVERARAILTESARRRIEVHESRWLDGLLWCGTCGQLMGARWVRGGQYSCTHPSPVNPARCGHTYLDAGAGEAEILARVKDALSRGILPQPIQSHRGSAVDASEQAAITQLGMDYDDGLISRTEWLARRNRLAHRTEHPHSGTSSQIADTVEGFTDPAAFKAAWDAATPRRRHTLLTTIITRIDVAPRPIRQSFKSFDPTRLTIHWADTHTAT